MAPCGPRMVIVSSLETLMPRRLTRSAALALVAGGLLCVSPPLVAQWLKYPSAGVPRTRDGKVNPTAPAPRTREGQPDFSGLWLTADGLPCAQQTLGQEFLVCGAELPISRYGI